MCICVYRCHRSMWMRFCVCHCAAVGSGLTVPINISIKAELSRRVEHLSFLSVLPRSLPPSLIASPIRFSHFPPFLPLPLSQEIQKCFEQSTQGSVLERGWGGLYVSGEVTDRVTACSGWRVCKLGFAPPGLDLIALSTSAARWKCCKSASHFCSTLKFGSPLNMMFTVKS